MTIIGCYTMDLYCDYGGGPYGETCPNRPRLESVFAQYYGKTERECLSQAKRDGWRFEQNNTLATCPKCVHQRKRGKTKR